MKNRMQYSKQGEALTERFEGCDLEAYQDIRGIWTIGYGHTKGVHEGMTCTQDEADFWLMDDTHFASDAVNDLVEVDLNQHQFDALVDFVFNLGIGSFKKSTMLKLLNKGDFDGAADQFERWDHAGGKEVAGLLRRRQAEEQEFKA